MARSRSLSMSGLLCRYGREAWAAVRHDLIKMLGESYLHATVLALVDDDRQHVGPHLRAMQDTDQAALVMPVGRLPRGFLCRAGEGVRHFVQRVLVSVVVAPFRLPARDHRVSVRQRDRKRTPLNSRQHCAYRMTHAARTKKTK